MTQSTIATGLKFRGRTDRKLLTKLAFFTFLGIERHYTS